MISGNDAELSEKSLRAMLKLAKVGPDDVVYHLGCGGSPRGIIIALEEFGAAKAIGIDSDAVKVSGARVKLDKWQQSRNNALSEGQDQKGEGYLRCADIRDENISDATVILFWFANDEELIRAMTKKFESLNSRVRIVTVWGPLPGHLPDAVDFPYVMCHTPLSPAADVQEQMRAVFGRDCIDFVTAWEHAERYTKALGPPDTKNDRFLTIIQTLTIWINAWQMGIACGDKIPESIATYVKIMKMNFDIDFGHMLGDGWEQQTGSS